MYQELETCGMGQRAGMHWKLLARCLILRYTGNIELTATWPSGSVHVLPSYHPVMLHSYIDRQLYQMHAVGAIAKHHYVFPNRIATRQKQPDPIASLRQPYPSRD